MNKSKQLNPFPAPQEHKILREKAYFCALNPHAMLLFFGDTSQKVFVVDSTTLLSLENTLKLQWLFGEAPVIDATAVSGRIYWTTSNHDYTLEYKCSRNYPEYGN